MTVRTALLLILAASTAFAPVEARGRTATTAERRACEARLQPRIDEIDARLRAGYSAEEGERLKARRRRLEAEKAACRKA